MENLHWRDLLKMTGWAGFGIVASLSAWPLVDALHPSADALALAGVIVDLTPDRAGEPTRRRQAGKPVWIRHKTQRELAATEATHPSGLRDPAT